MSFENMIGKVRCLRPSDSLRGVLMKTLVAMATTPQHDTLFLTNGKRKSPCRSPWKEGTLRKKDTCGIYYLNSYTVSSLAAMIYEDRAIKNTEEACHLPHSRVYQWAVHRSGAAVLVKRSDDPNLLRIASKLENRASLADDKHAKSSFIRNNPPPF